MALRIRAQMPTAITAKQVKVNIPKSASMVEFRLSFSIPSVKICLPVVSRSPLGLPIPSSSFLLDIVQSTWGLRASAGPIGFPPAQSITDRSIDEKATGFIAADRPFVQGGDPLKFQCLADVVWSIGCQVTAETPMTHKEFLFAPVALRSWGGAAG